MKMVCTVFCLLQFIPFKPIFPFWSHRETEVENCFLLHSHVKMSHCVEQVASRTSIYLRLVSYCFCNTLLKYSIRSFESFKSSVLFIRIFFVQRTCEQNIFHVYSNSNKDFIFDHYTCLTLLTKDKSYDIFVTFQKLFFRYGAMVSNAYQRPWQICQSDSFIWSRTGLRSSRFYWPCIQSSKEILRRYSLQLQVRVRSLPL